jgi:hypothetical protein
VAGEVVLELPGSHDDRVGQLFELGVSQLGPS